ncbi:MAG: MFS transporter [Chloroflexota bacterium]
MYATAPAVPRPGETARNPWLVLLVLCGAVFMLLLDTTIVNVAQQVIKDDLGATLPQIQWILDSYILAYAVLLLSFGRLGDVLGRKRMFVCGMAVFIAASVLCGLSTAIGDLLGISASTALIASRVLQGVGGALMMPQTLSLITVAFPPEQRGAAMGAWGSVVSLGAILGPLIGGFIVSHAAWQWIFLINVPIGIVAIVATIAIVPESVDPLASRRIDWAGVGLSGFGIFAFVYAAIEGNHRGWTDPLILGLLTLSVLLLALFVWWERRCADPMMKLELFDIRNFSAGNVIGLLVSFGMLGIFFPLTLFLQGGLGLSPIAAGLAMTPMSLIMMFAAPASGRLSDRVGARWILIAGLTLMSAGILLLSGRLSPATDWHTLWPALLLLGTAMGMTFAPLTAATMAQVPPRIAGSASGILNTNRNIGQVLGIAILGSVLQTRLGVHAAGAMAAVDGLEPETAREMAALVRDSRLSEIPTRLGVLQPGQTESLPQVFGAAQEAFAASIHDTFAAAAAACLLALLAAFFIRNPRSGGAAPSARHEASGGRAA